MPKYIFPLIFYALLNSWNFTSIHLSSYTSAKWFKKKEKVDTWLKLHTPYYLVLIYHFIIAVILFLQLVFLSIECLVHPLTIKLLIPFCLQMKLYSMLLLMSLVVCVLFMTCLRVKTNSQQEPSNISSQDIPISKKVNVFLLKQKGTI